MKFTDQHRFPYDSDTVLKAFTDKNYFTAKYEKLGNHDIEVLECDEGGDTFRIKASYSQPSDAPAMVQKLIGDTMNVVQEDTWNKSSKTGSLDIEIGGLPGSIKAEMTLTDDGDGSVNTIEWEVTVKVPLVGGKIEKMMKDDIEKKGKEDVAATTELLANY